MRDPGEPRTIQRLLIVLPTWLGDTVMATPTLAALRALYPQAHITGLIKRPVRPILEAGPWLDRLITLRPRRHGRSDARRESLLALGKRLRAGRFDMAILLPNSFRTALLARLARIPRRVGYDRDGRGSLLTDRLIPRRALGGQFVPVPTRDYYLGIARYLGARDPDIAMTLHTRPTDDARALAMLRQGGYDPASGRPLVILNPGANYGDAKMWMPDRFAGVADELVARLGVVVAVSGSPRERAILDQVHAAAKTPLLDLPRLGADLTLLKSVFKSAGLLVTNDTGPRHMAAAMGVPVVTVFGPTDPAWTEIHFPLERQVMVNVFCGPCQKKRCPLDHRCMTQITPAMVAAQAAALLNPSQESLATPQAGSTRPAGVLPLQQADPGARDIP